MTSIMDVPKGTLPVNAINLCHSCLQVEKSLVISVTSEGSEGAAAPSRYIFYFSAISGQVRY